MWNRIELKYKAKQTLKGTYVNGLIVSFLMMLASGAWMNKRDGGKHMSGKFNFNDFSGDISGHDNFFDALGFPTVLGLVLGFLTVVVAMVFIKLLVGYLIEVGGQKYFLKARNGESTINHVTYGFSSGKWMNIVKTMFLRSLFTYLWTLLLIIPGIIKYYSYRMVPYILAQNPDADSFEAIAMSKEMTDGHKMDMFVMDLSFIGWFILGGLLFGIGTILVMPYYNATYAELYYTLKGEEEKIAYEG